MPAALPAQFIPLIDGFTERRGKRVLVNQFGDGYPQRVDDSINTIERQLTLKFLTNTDTTASPATLQAFLDARGLSDPISWKSPTDASPQNWLITEPYDRTDLVGNPLTGDPRISMFTVKVKWVPF